MKPRIDQKVIDLYDAYTHGLLERRDFLTRLARISGGAAAATALLPLLANDYARAAIVVEDDPRIDVAEVEFEVAAAVSEDLGGEEGVDPALASIIRAYRAKPRMESILPAVIVIHENRGLNAHIKDIARRLALEGYQAFAVDMLTPFGGTPADEDRARGLIARLPREKTAGRIAEVAHNLEMVKTHRRKVGAVGFCWGGGMVNALAAVAPGLDGGVAYYGRQGTAEEAKAIRAALLFHYAGLDERINVGIADFEEALKAAGVRFESHLYQGAQHAFNNDSNEARYDAEAAGLAWSRTVAFFKKYLK